MPFVRYIGIDYSGARTPTSSLKGLRVFAAGRDAEHVEVLPPPGPRRYWTRRGVAEWLAGRLAEPMATLVGIDHGFSFPRAYFEAYGVSADWTVFLEDFCRHWPTDGDDVYVDSARNGVLGDAAARLGSPRRRRITEIHAHAKSVFQFDVQGSVAKSTHSGLPWLQYLRRRVGDRVHFWPFDGWTISEGRSAVAEAYPSLWRHLFPGEGLTADQRDAYTAAGWMRQADLDGSLSAFLEPGLNPRERDTARIEGWILGVR